MATRIYFNWKIKKISVQELEQAMRETEMEYHCEWATLLDESDYYHNNDPYANIREKYKPEMGYKPHVFAEQHLLQKHGCVGDAYSVIGLYITKFMQFADAKKYLPPNIYNLVGKRVTIPWWGYISEQELAEMTPEKYSRYTKDRLLNYCKDWVNFGNMIHSENAQHWLGRAKLVKELMPEYIGIDDIIEAIEYVASDPDVYLYFG